MLKSIEVAARLLDKSIKRAQDNPKYYMDYIKLHKLMFLAECLICYEYDIDLFKEKVTTEDTGPYIGGLELITAVYGFGKIKNIESLKKYVWFFPLPLLRDETCDYILDMFGELSTIEIVRLTKNTIAYQESYNKDETTTVKNNTIKRDLMKKTGEILFKQKVEWHHRRKSIELKEGINKMNEKLEVKDELYYDDMIYEIKSLAGFQLIRDKSVEERIRERYKNVLEEDPSGLLVSGLSIFEEEIFEIIQGISKKVEISFTSLTNISRYEEAVNEVIIRLENQRNNCRNIVSKTESENSIIANRVEKLNQVSERKKTRKIVLQKNTKNDQE